jgi:hypothetical protein
MSKSYFKGVDHRLFIVRIATAMALFAVLGKANIWLDLTTNGVLAVGYRVLLLLTPLTLILIGAKSLSFSAAVAAGALLILSVTNQFTFAIAAALMFAYGIAVAGYLIKSEAAQTKEGAAYNKIALNLGSLLAGLILIVPNLGAAQFFLGMAIVLLLCVPLTWCKTMPATSAPRLMITQKNWLGQLAWATAGVVIGIKLFAVFAVLPQAILSKVGVLPGWYGFMLILNSAIVIILQMPIMRLIEQMGRYSLHGIIAVIAIGFVALAMPRAFHVHTFWGAVIWITLLSIAECSFSYLDYFAARQNGIFIKELAVGIGAGMTVFVMRVVSEPLSSALLAAIGVAGIAVWLLLTRQIREVK